MSCGAGRADVLATLWLMEILLAKEIIKDNIISTDNLLITGELIQPTMPGCLMSYIVEKIRGAYAVEPGGRYSGRQQKKGRHPRREEEQDTVSISAEARERSVSDEHEHLASDRQE
jgi:hypothetical protein